MQILQHEIEIPPFLLDATIDMLDGKEVSFALPSQIRAAMQTPEKISVSECAGRYRTVTAVDAMPGPWRNDLMPHTVQPMDSYARPWVKEIWLCWPERAAKTNVMLNCLAWTKLYDSGNAFWLDPAEDDTGKNVKTKIIPMFRDSEKLCDCLSSRADDTGKGLIAFHDGTFLFPAHANSARSMANFFGLHNFGNEVDKFPMMTGAETNPINLIRKRGRDVPGSKYMFSSTPAGRHIYKGTLACRQVWELRSKCPHCDAYILMDDEHIVIPEGATPDQAENGEVELGYTCNACGNHWDDQDRQESFLQGQWFCIKGEDSKRPRTIGFHASALPFPMVPLTEYCAKFLRSKTGDLSDKVDYAHGYRVEDFKAEISDRKEDDILRLRDQRAAGTFPVVADALEISIDTQDHGFWYRIRAWQYGLSLTSWLVKAGYVTSSSPDDFTALDTLLASEFPDENGEPHRIMAGIIDAMGHRTAEVYAWCRRTGILAAAGAPGRKTQPITVSRIDRFPGNGRPIPGGLSLYSIDTHYHKDLLANKLLIDPTDPGAFILHSGYTYDQVRALERDPSQKLGHNLGDYSRQMCVEARDDRGLWQCGEGKANHLWDCESNGLALVMWLGWQNAISEKNNPAPSTPKNNPQAAASVNSRPGWFNNR
ncbi:MAG: hypothetical protein A2075_09180 [Geobacteraceae bacterium GWC2_58_44]|nr:MAG: hypothetical protein A2075_09180 [Geobacteraceae bacterium GWC2_58_44]HBG07685.1 hypothetical protein [Geobacter sp.]